MLVVAVIGSPTSTGWLATPSSQNTPQESAGTNNLHEFEGSSDSWGAMPETYGINNTGCGSEGHVGFWEGNAGLVRSPVLWCFLRKRSSLWETGAEGAGYHVRLMTEVGTGILM